MKHIRSSKVKKLFKTVKKYIEVSDNADNPISEYSNDNEDVRNTLINHITQAELEDRYLDKYKEAEEDLLIIDEFLDLVDLDKLESDKEQEVLRVYNTLREKKNSIRNKKLLANIVLDMKYTFRGIYQYNNDLKSLKL